MARSISEMAAVTMASFGRESRRIVCMLGHSVGKVVIIEATIASGRLDSNLRKMEVVLGERNKGMNGIDEAPTPHISRVFRFGNKGSLMVRSWITDKTSRDRMSGLSNCVNIPIL